MLTLTFSTGSSLLTKWVSDLIMGINLTDKEIYMCFYCILFKKILSDHKYRKFVILHSITSFLQERYSSSVFSPCIYRMHMNYRQQHSACAATLPYQPFFPENSDIFHYDQNYVYYIY